MSENYKAAYSMLFPPIRVENEPFLLRLFSPTVQQADRAFTQKLLWDAKRTHSPFSEEQLFNVAGNTIELVLGENPSEILIKPMYECVRKLMEYEPALFQEPRIDAPEGMKEEVEYRHYLRASIKMHKDVQASLSEWAATVAAALAVSTTPLPHQEEGILIGQEAILTFWKGREELSHLWHMWFVTDDYFKPLKEQLWRNLCSVNGVDPKNANAKIYPPSHFLEKDISNARILFANTPMWDLLNTPVPVYLPKRLRFEHHYILGGTGSGKTRTFENLIVHDLVEVMRKEATVVVIEPDGALIDRLSRLEMWKELTDSLTIIDPKDVDYPVALNMFDVNMQRLSTYSPLVREQTVNGVIELFDYVFGSLLASELTGKQSTLFRYVVRLMLAIPGSNIQTLREIFEPEGYKKYEKFAATLTGAASHFFRTEWGASEFRATKSQILRRIWQLLENSTFERMFSHPRSRLDLTAELNEGGRLILINTAQSLLKAQGSELFGRLFIALITQCALEREAIPESKRKPVYVYIDEASPYIDQNIETILTQARKYKIGLVLAHQHLGQLQTQHRQTIASNTSIKMASGLSHADATAMSRDMRCDSDYIDKMKKGQFATYIKGITEHAVRYSVQFDLLDQFPTMSNDDYDQVKQAMRDRYSTPVIPTPEPEVIHTPPEEDETKAKPPL